MTWHEALDDWLIAVRAPRAGSRTLLKAIHHHGGMAAVRAAARRRQSGLPETAEQYLRHPDEALLASDRDWLSQPDHHLLTWGSEWYPSLLADIAGPPCVLFVVGDPAVLWQPQVAIVGSRKASDYGIDNARYFAGNLASRGVVITSGLAQGIDSVAHQAALAAGGRTVAVLGTGVDRVYPRQHVELARNIAANGALVSELPLGSEALPGHFPARNRIISGLALGALVVEAGVGSGSLITARLAAEQGREVMAVPGMISNRQARGCHQLIRDGARLVDSPVHIMEDLQPMAARLAGHLHAALATGDDSEPDAEVVAKGPARTIDEVTEDPLQRQLLRALNQRPQAIDEIVECTDLTAEAVSSMLLVMELEGLVKCHPGGTWSRNQEIIQ
ncbi:MAG: DNA-processing protein DprA [Wenzhouxiangellaceae bacterium]